MTITGKLHVDGNIEGRISSVEDVSIGRTGFVKGYIRAKSITVSGLLEGEVHCDHLHILAGGRVVASVTSVELMTDLHSQFIGERRESSGSIFDKAAEQAQLADDIDLDIIDNLPNKITLDDSAKEPNKSYDNQEDELELDISELDDSQQLIEEQGEDLNSQSLNEKSDKSNPSLDDLGLLSYMEGLEFLDELDTQCDKQQDSEQELGLDPSVQKQNVNGVGLEQTVPKSVDEHHNNDPEPAVSAVVKIVTELGPLEIKNISNIEQLPVGELPKQAVVESDKIDDSNSESIGSKRIDENTTKLELKF